MTVRLELYICKICGNIVQIMHEGEGEIICCGEVMSKIEPHNHEEEMQEKHIPVFTHDNKIQVGSTPHPMTKEHYIEFIQCYSEDKKYIETKFLTPEDKPEFEPSSIQNSQAREYCNIHGLWIGHKN